jgi:hypothetical protein
MGPDMIVANEAVASIGTEDIQMILSMRTAWNGCHDCPNLSQRNVCSMRSSSVLPRGCAFLRSVSIRVE